MAMPETKQITPLTLSENPTNSQNTGDDRTASMDTKEASNRIPSNIKFHEEQLTPNQTMTTLTHTKAEQSHSIPQNDQAPTLPSQPLVNPIRNRIFIDLTLSSDDDDDTPPALIQRIQARDKTSTGVKKRLQPGRCTAVGKQRNQKVLEWLEGWVDDEGMKLG